jgi:hypothetical protein
MSWTPLVLLQRVLYRSAKQDWTRRFHALFDKLARRDVMWRAWVGRGHQSTMVWHRGCWRRLERSFAARGVEEVSLDLAMAWVDEACGGF